MDIRPSTITVSAIWEPGTDLGLSCQCRYCQKGFLERAFAHAKGALRKRQTGSKMATKTSGMVFRALKFGRVDAGRDAAYRSIFLTRPGGGTIRRYDLALLEKQLSGPKINSWYPPPMASYKLPGYTSERDINKEERKERLMARGKTPVKKGEGKRSKKGKKK